MKIKNFIVATLIGAGTLFLAWCELVPTTSHYSKSIIGKYQTTDGESFLIREYASGLQLLYSGNDFNKPAESIYFFKSIFKVYPIKTLSGNNFEFVWNNDFDLTGFDCKEDWNGNYTECDLWNKIFKRNLFPSESWQTFKITPIKSIEEVRQEAMNATPPVENWEFLTSDLVELKDIYTWFKLDIKYATTDNFMWEQMYTQARAFLQRPAAEALIKTAEQLKLLWYGVVIYDAYRPWTVTKMFWDSTPDAQKNFVADPSKGSRHNRGGAVDIWLYDLSNWQIIEMPSWYDEFSERAYPSYPGGNTKARWHRDLMRYYMENNWFTVNDDERWHFDFQWWEKYPINNVEFDKIPKPELEKEFGQKVEILKQDK